MKKGIFIAVEGIDGSGKSTLVDGLIAHFKSQGIDVVKYADFYSTDFGRSLGACIKHDPSCKGALPESEIAAVTAMRVEGARKIIDPALLESKIVIADRFRLSTDAYQGQGYPRLMKLVEESHKLFIQTSPDITLCLQLSADEAIARAASRGTLDNIESRGPEYFKRAIGCFNDASAWISKLRYINATLSPEEVLAHSISIIDAEIQWDKN